MTTMIIAADRREARDVARHLQLLEWFYVHDASTLQGTARPVIVLAPGASRHPKYYDIIRTAQGRDAQLFEVDAWREKFMFVAILVKCRAGYEPVEREEYVRDEDAARRLDGADGWMLVWYGKADGQDGHGL